MPTAKFAIELEGEEALKVIQALTEMITDTIQELEELGVHPTFIAGFVGDSVEFDEFRRSVTIQAKDAGLETELERGESHKDLMDRQIEAQKNKNSMDPFIGKLRDMLKD